VATALTVNPSATAVGAINDHFVGLSFESGTLNSGQFDNVGNLAQLLRNLGSSVLRFGGLTVDRPSFTGITPSALAGLVRLAKASNWTVLYSENLGNYNAAAVTADAKAVAAALGPRLSGIACGNEPDGFVSDGWRLSPYTAADFQQEAAACLAAVRAGAPHAPLEGADLTGAPTWLAPYAKQESGQLASVGQHIYPAGCVGDYAGEPAREAAGKLLSPATFAKEVSILKWAAADAKIAKAPLRISEANSICGGGLAGVSNSFASGLAGVSNSFASALWAIDFLLTAAENGVSGVNLHGGLNSAGDCFFYSPLCQVAGQPNEYAARPLYYGMLFTHLLGTGNLLPVTLTTRPVNDDVKAFALKPATGGGLRVLVENMTYLPANVTLSVASSTKSVSVLHLTAPGLTATSGVRIQGAAVGASGTIKPGAPTIIKCSSGKCQLPITPYTAVLVTIP
ncbi:MAG TPA: hypothetical protein VI365_09600, partial [Trebonia sp.]